MIAGKMKAVSTMYISRVQSGLTDNAEETRLGKAHTDGRTKLRNDGDARLFHRM